MANELLHALIRANVAGGIAALIMLGARAGLRPLIGPAAVYALWLVVPAAALASLAPARTVEVLLQASPSAAVAAGNPAINAAFDAAAPLVCIWLGGVAIIALGVGWRQLKFLALFGQVQRRRRVIRSHTVKAGPAVVGVFWPRILLPADFGTRFTAMQRRVVLAHEAVHLSRGDSRINAAVLLLQCLGWFNPVLHLAARALRLDQELSCDAAVMARFPQARRSYAEAMLKSQADAISLPLGCYWPARGPSALSRRLLMLRAAPLSSRRVVAGLTLAGLTAISAGAVAWSAQPPRVRIVLADRTPNSLPPSVIQTAEAPQHIARRRGPSIRSGPQSQAQSEGLATVKTVVAVQASWRPNMAHLFEWDAMPMPPEAGEAVAEVANHTGPTAPDGGMSQVAVSEATSATYRNGAYQMKSDFNRVGDTVEVTARLYREGEVIGAGNARTIPGETAYVALSNGQVATLTPGKVAYIMTRPRGPWDRRPPPNQDLGPSSDHF